MEGDGSSASASFHGFVADQYDAALLVTAARLGFIPRFRRRLDIVEQRAFIHSGAVFLWNEEESYMKRWTDGYPWSPSRVQSKFLVYREMAKRGGARSRTAARLLGYTPESSADSTRRKHIRNLASSLFNRGELEFLDLYSNSGYPRTDDIFRRGGLVKKTFTITLPKETWHVVAYYTLEDILHDRLATPSESSALRHSRILTDVTDVLEGSSRSLFGTTTTLRMLTPLPWTTPFLNADELEPAAEPLSSSIRTKEESLDYHPGILDLATPQTSSSSSISSTSSPSPPASLPPFPSSNRVSSTDDTKKNNTIVAVYNHSSEHKPNGDRDVSVMSFSSSSDSINLHSGTGGSWSDSPCSLHYDHPHPHPHHPSRHHHSPHQTLNTDPNITTTLDSLPPSPVTIFASDSQSPNFSEYSDYVEEVYADVDVEDHNSVHVYHHPYHDGQPYYTLHDHQPHYYDYTDTDADTNMLTTVYSTTYY